MNIFIRLLRYLLVAFLLLGGALLADQKEDWIPITQQDLQIKEVPGNPGTGGRSQA